MATRPGWGGRVLAYLTGNLNHVEPAILLHLDHPPQPRREVTSGKVWSRRVASGTATEEVAEEGGGEDGVAAAGA
eukprot:g39879.t1